MNAASRGCFLPRYIHGINMTPDEFTAGMTAIELNGGDPESNHNEADKLIMRLLRELGYDDGADIFDNMKKWYA